MTGVAFAGRFDSRTDDVRRKTARPRAVLVVICLALAVHFAGPASAEPVHTEIASLHGNVDPNAELTLDLTGSIGAVDLLIEPNILGTFDLGAPALAIARVPDADLAAFEQSLPAKSHVGRMIDTHAKAGITDAPHVIGPAGLDGFAPTAPSEPDIDLAVDILVNIDGKETRHFIKPADVGALELTVPAEPDVDPAVDIHVKLDEDKALSASVPLPLPRPRLELAARELIKVPPPAEQLRLDAEARSKEEECLARAIYFEARGETVRGQVAVAQVIMNRVFSKFYPGSVCGVVYQNADKLNACQFSFACDGKEKFIKDQAAWSLAEHIAKLTLDGRIWEPDIGRATHFHAVWVKPSWVGEMRKLASHGVHIYYRPQQWGDGSDEPTWHRVAHTGLPALN